MKNTLTAGELTFVNSKFHPACIFAEITGAVVCFPWSATAYCSKKKIEELKRGLNKSIKTYAKSLIVHETVHVFQYRDEGMTSAFQWIKKYYFNKDFRALMESEAYRAGAEVFLLELGADNTRTQARNDLSSWKYLWCGSIETVLNSETISYRAQEAINSLEGTPWEIIRRHSR